MNVKTIFADKNNKVWWLTADNHLIDPDLVNAPLPELLRQLLNLTSTPLEMIYRIQQGLGVYDKDGNIQPIGTNGTRPKPEGYQLFADTLAWLHSNYPGGWFYAVETLYQQFQEGGLK